MSGGEWVSLYVCVWYFLCFVNCPFCTCIWSIEMRVGICGCGAIFEAKIDFCVSFFIVFILLFETIYLVNAETFRLSEQQGVSSFLCLLPILSLQAHINMHTFLRCCKGLGCLGSKPFMYWVIFQGLKHALFSKFVNRLCPWMSTVPGASTTFSQCGLS